MLRGAGQTGGVVTVDVPGGRLTVSLTGEECVLTGPAVLVAHGVVSLAALGANRRDVTGPADVDVPPCATARPVGG
jgi:hypothetical protein